MADQQDDVAVTPPAFMTDVEVEADIARLTEKRHRMFAVFQVSGGWVIRCLNCKIEGKRTYQSRATAIAIADDLRAIDKSECSHAPTTIP